MFSHRLGHTAYAVWINNFIYSIFFNRYNIIKITVMDVYRLKYTILQSKHFKFLIIHLQIRKYRQIYIYIYIFSQSLIFRYHIFVFFLFFFLFIFYCMYIRTRTDDVDLDSIEMKILSLAKASNSTEEDDNNYNCLTAECNSTGQ